MSVEEDARRICEWIEERKYTEDCGCLSSDLLIPYYGDTMRITRLMILSASCAVFLAACGKEPPPVPAPLESRESLETKANAGDADAQFELGAAYHDGSGGPKDLAIAKSWFEKAAAQGEVRAEFNLGVMYYMGEGVKQDYDVARDWFEKAAEKKNPRAQFNLGVMYYRAEGVQQNFDKAKEYFALSGGQGFQEAAFNLGVMHAKGEGAEPDIGQAYAWFSLARDLGSERAPEVIKNIERALKPDQLELVQKMATALKEEVQKETKDR